MPKDFLAALPAGGGYRTRALAADAEKWPKVPRTWHKHLGIKRLRGAPARATIVLLLTHMCGMITTKDD